MIYMISYDLNSPTNNREKVMADIESIGTWCKYLTTTYLVSTTKFLSEVKSVATKNLDANDKMIIGRIKTPVDGQLPQKEKDWISMNLTQIDYDAF